MSRGHEHSGNCREIFALLSEYLDGELDDEGRERLDRHLAGCPPCVGFLTSLRRTVGLVRDLPARELPAEVRRELIDTRRRMRESERD